MEKKLDQYVGCLLGGAIEDAPGAPIEFMSTDQIFNVYGHGGVQGFEEHPEGKGEFTGDTQMLLFTS